MKRFIAVVLLLVLVLSQSCAVIVNGSRAKIRITPADPNASLELNGQSLGSGPKLAMVKRNHINALKVKDASGKENTVLLQRKAQAGWIVATVLLWGLIGVAIDGATGSWNKIVDYKDSTVEVNQVSKETVITEKPPVVNKK
jgi:hypothetical protein